MLIYSALWNAVVLEAMTKVFAALLALIFTAGLTLAVGHGVRMLIDNGFSQQSQSELTTAISFILTITILIAIGTFFRFYLVS